MATLIQVDPDVVMYHVAALFGIPKPVRLEALRRHSNGDWGFACDETCSENDRAMREGHGRVVSLFSTQEGIQFEVISRLRRGCRNAATTLRLTESEHRRHMGIIVV